MDDTPITPDEEVVDGEIVETSATEETNTSVSDNSAVLLSLDEMIKATFSSIDRLSTEKGKLSDMVNDGLNNDANYKQAADAAKAAGKAKQAAKQEVMGRAGVIELVNKLKDITSELKEKQASLSDYVLEYQRLAGVNQIELPNGEILEIVQTAKLVKKFSKKK